ncbi:MAG: mechanosensitive ion channel domain-containing protein, partial [Candidatus Heimdallarchaeaceae archaeon]
GLSMVFSKHHNVGDYLFIPEMNVEGVVQSISVSYITILQPNETTAVIPVRKIREHEIINIAIAEYEEEKHEDISKFFMYGERIAETDFVYPLNWATHSDDRHSDAVKAIEKTALEYNDQLNEPVEWCIHSRDRLNRLYQIKLTVLDPEKLLTLTSAFLKTLESNYEKIKNKNKK